MLRIIRPIGLAALLASIFCSVRMGGCALSAATEDSHPIRPPDASAAARLTHDGRFKQHPAWSPDGKTLAYTLYADGKVGLVALEPGTQQPRPITPFDENPEYEPAWAPDGKHMAFVHDMLSGTDGQLEIHRMNADGGAAKRLVTPAKRPAQDEHPSWSPDGSAIAFTSTRDGNQEIYLCDPEGNNLRRITSHPAIDSHPTWSPDAQQIAFASSRFGNLEICLMNRDGSGIRRLTDHPAMDYNPKWSPDGKWIAFTSTRDGNYEIYVVRPDGTGLRNVTTNPALDKDAAWSPDSTHLTFVSNRDGGFDLYTIPIQP
jgi:TolB protein